MWQHQNSFDDISLNTEPTSLVGLRIATSGLRLASGTVCAWAVNGSPSIFNFENGCCGGNGTNHVVPSSRLMVYDVVVQCLVTPDTSQLLNVPEIMLGCFHLEPRDILRQSTRNNSLYNMRCAATHKISDPHFHYRLIVLFGQILKTPAVVSHLQAK